MKAALRSKKLELQAQAQVCRLVQDRGMCEVLQCRCSWSAMLKHDAMRRGTLCAFAPCAFLLIATTYIRGYTHAQYVPTTSSS